MLKIAICDDNLALCGELEDMIMDLQTAVSDRFDIDIFVNIQALWKALAKKESYDLIFSNIDLSDSLGDEMIKKISQELGDERVRIAYISNQSENASQMEHPQFVGYIQNPLDRTQVKNILVITSGIKKENNDFFEYSVDRVAQRIQHREIFYLAVEGKGLRIMTEQGQGDRYRGTLKAALAQLEPYGFIQINPSELVNSQYIVAYNGHTVTLSNGVVLIPTQTRRQVALEAFRIPGEEK